MIILTNKRIAAQYKTSPFPPFCERAIHDEPNLEIGCQQHPHFGSHHHQRQQSQQHDGSNEAMRGGVGHSDQDLRVGQAPHRPMPAVGDGDHPSPRKRPRPDTGDRGHNAGLIDRLLRQSGSIDPLTATPAIASMEPGAGRGLPMGHDRYYGNPGTLCPRNTLRRPLGNWPKVIFISVVRFHDPLFWNRDLGLILLFVILRL